MAEKRNRRKNQIDYMAYQDTFSDDKQTSGSPGTVGALLAAAIVLLVVLLRGCA